MNESDKAWNKIAGIIQEIDEKGNACPGCTCDECAFGLKFTMVDGEDRINFTECGLIILKCKSFTVNIENTRRTHEVRMASAKYRRLKGLS